MENEKSIKNRYHGFNYIQMINDFEISRKKILLAVSSLFLVLGLLLVSSKADLSDTQSSSPLSISSIEANENVESLKKVSECTSGKGALYEIKPHNIQVATFSDQVIGVRIVGTSTSWRSNQTLYFGTFSDKIECSKKNSINTGKALPSQDIIEVKKERFELELTSEGSQICRPGLGKLWESERSNNKIITFNETIIGIKSSSEPVFFKEPPTPSECLKQEYLTNPENISGKKIWDLNDWSDRKQKFYRRPKTSKCSQWYSGSRLSELDCQYTNSGIENVSLVADPSNFITEPITEYNHSTTIITRRLGEPSKSGIGMWDVEFLPNGTPIVTYPNGKVALYDEGVNIVDSVEGVLDNAAAGLMGLAVDPNFEENNYIYLYYTYSFGKFEINGNAKPTLSRISRFELENGKLQDEKILLDSISAHNFHTGGRLEFSPDGKLFATVGEGGAVLRNSPIAQNKSNLKGKILRMNKDGSVPEDNPFEGSYVFSRGHRNPQGLAWDPETGNLYAAEHGPWRHDEVNRIVPGGNYGWGRYKCGEYNKKVIPKIGETIEPVFCSHNWTLAPSGLTFVDEPGHPWHSDLFVASLRGKHVHRFETVNGSITHNEVFYIPSDIPGPNRIRDVEYRDGSLWVLGDQEWLARLNPENR